MENAPRVYTKGDVEVLRQTVAIGATDAELRMFVEMAKATGLNPFKREIWFIKIRDQVQMMTGINGFYQIANSYPEYDGIEVGLIGKEGEYLPLTYPKPDFIGAWAKVHRKDRSIPSEGVAMLAEYDKGHGNWRSMKRTMITKCAEAIALRKAIAQRLASLYVQEEVESDEAKVERKTAQKTEIKAKAEADKLPPVYEQSEEPIVYQIPYADVVGRQKLAKLGFKPDKTQKPWTWTGLFVVPELEDCRIIPAKDVPESMVVSEQELNEIQVEWEE